MTKQDVDNIISVLCPNDEDFEKPIISPAYLKKELEALALEQEPCEDERCACLTKKYVPIRYEVVGYGRKLNVGVSFSKQEIFASYDYACDSGRRKSLAIKYCPFCGRKLDKTDKE